MGTQKAFTLIELVIVMALISAIGLMASASFQNYAINVNLKNAVREVSSDIALLKERATAENRIYRMELDLENAQCFLEQCNNLGAPCAGWTAIQVRNLKSYSDDIVFKLEGTTVWDYRFQPRGTATTGTMVFTNSRGSTGLININLTGRANVQFNFQ